jgi:hypothetical protein
LERCYAAPAAGGAASELAALQPLSKKQRKGEGQQGGGLNAHKQRKLLS